MWFCGVGNVQLRVHAAKTHSLSKYRRTTASRRLQPSAVRKKRRLPTTPRMGRDCEPWTIFPRSPVKELLAACRTEVCGWSSDGFLRFAAAVDAQSGFAGGPIEPGASAMEAG